MFDFMQGGKANLQLVLDRLNQPYWLGETIHATLKLTGEKELKIEQGRIVLLYHEEYQFRRRHVHRDSKGHTSTREESVWTTDEREVKRDVFLDQATIPGGTLKTMEFEFPIPLNAAPTAAGGKIVRIKWLVKATLDRRMAADTQAVVEVPVLTTPPGQFVQAGVYGMSNEPAEAELSLSLPVLEFVLGETIEGQLQVCPQKEFDVSEIRVELVRREVVPRELGHQVEEVVPLKAAAGSRLKPGSNLTLPFRLAIPASAPPTLQTPNSQVNWFVRGVLARRMRKDTSAEQEVAIFSRRI